MAPRTTPTLTKDCHWDEAATRAAVDPSAIEATMEIITY